MLKKKEYTYQLSLHDNWRARKQLKSLKISKIIIANEVIKRRRKKKKKELNQYLDKRKLYHVTDWYEKYALTKIFEENIVKILAMKINQLWIYYSNITLKIVMKKKSSALFYNMIIRYPPRDVITFWLFRIINYFTIIIWFICCFWCRKRKRKSSLIR